jgi:hypothetical protein
MLRPKATSLAFTSARSQSVRYLRPQFKLVVRRISAYRLVAELALIVAYLFSYSIMLIFVVKDAEDQYIFLQRRFQLVCPCMIL